MDAPNPKRPCRCMVSSSTIQNPNSQCLDQSHFDTIISSLLSFPDTSSLNILGSSLDRVLDKALASASSDIFAQNQLVDRTRELISVLQKSFNRCFRKRASLHNLDSWFLPKELTIKVFSNLDTKSLMQAMICCTLFQNCAMDPLSYSHINLTTCAKNVDDGVVRTMIHRAGKQLRFLEIGHVDGHDKPKKSLLKGSCLSPLSYNNGFLGKCLKRLHLYDVRYLKDKSNVGTLSSCPNITDLKIVGLYSPSDQLLKSLKCRFIDTLFLEISGLPKSRKKSKALVEFLANLPNLTSLTLIGFKLKDPTVQKFAKGLHKLKRMNLSRNPLIYGLFLRDSGKSLGFSELETLILQDCKNLAEEEVLQFLDSLLAGKFRFIKHIDISNDTGLVGKYGKRSITPNFPLDKLKEYRPNVKFVATFKDSLSSNNVQVQSVDEDSSSDSSSSSSSSEDE